MARLRSNNVFGTITDDPLSGVVTTMNSAGLANLAAVAGADRAVITLDPNRVNGAPEIVYVTAHTGSATSATILRGQEGTAARQHPSGTFWVHAPTAVDHRPYSPPACRVFHNTTQSVGGAGAGVVLLFNSERYDTDGMHSTSVNTGRITFNTAGLYVVGAQMIWPSDNDYTGIFLDIRLNGVTPIASDYDRFPGTGTGARRTVPVTTAYKFNVADYVDMYVAQINTSVGAATIPATDGAAPEFWATWIGEG